MKVLVTGSGGFIAKNLIEELKNRGYSNILECDRNTESVLLERFCKEADFVFHLAGVNRPQDTSEFMEGNFNFTEQLLQYLNKANNNCPILISSSIQADLDNLYGISKKAGEQLLFSHARENESKVLIYRFPNVFGKWIRPNYNSAIATFCYNIAHDIPIQVNDPKVKMKLVYIDDVVEELIKALKGEENKVNDYCEVSPVYEIELGDIVKLIHSFKQSRYSNIVPDMSDLFTKKLYSTYLSYLPKDKFSYDLKMNVDDRGSFTEFIKTQGCGQVSINISKPGIIKGNHWHHTKNEKFLVVSGKGVIRFRKIGTNEILEYFVSDKKLEVVDIPVGYTHSIENLGDKDMVTVMWANEEFNPHNPDTYFVEV